MADEVTLVPPRRLRKNPENPRLIFRKDDLDALESSIRTQGILVPLTVFPEGDGYMLLDGERRWRCAIKLNLTRVPVIVQPRPERLENIMMMFAIHNARRDWDPLPTAMKLGQLELEFEERQGRKPTEEELAGAASMKRSEVRRLRNMLALPEKYRDELMGELQKPRTDQVLTVDHVLEATRGAAALTKRKVITPKEEGALVEAIVDKFRTKVVDNTVAPRQLVRMARAVQRNEIPSKAARDVTLRLIKEPKYTIAQAFTTSVEHVDFEHGVEQLVDRLTKALEEHRQRKYEVGDGLAESLRTLSKTIRRFLA